MNLAHEDLQEILRLLETSTFDELRLETDRFKLTLRRSANGGWTQEKQILGKPRLFRGSEATPGAATLIRRPGESLADANGQLTQTDPS